MQLTEGLQDCFGVNLSQGTVDNILQDLSRKSLPVYNEIRNRIEQSSIVGADKTSENISMENYTGCGLGKPQICPICIAINHDGKRL